MKVKGGVDQTVDTGDFRKVDEAPIEVEKFPTPEEQRTTPDEMLISNYQKYVLNKSPACMRRIQRLKVSDKKITEMLETNEGRKQIGYNYLVRRLTDG